LPEPLKDLIQDPEQQINASLISFWEMAIKLQLNKLKLPEPLQDLLLKTQAVQIELLPLKAQHILTLQTLPLHHRDPFDRILLAQCQSESMIFISKDRAFEAYGIPCIWENA
jgi:PIN domain nuclease of toxin-antitoxin system